MTSITIPDSVTSICHDAFSYCSGLTSIEVNENNPTYHSSGDCLIETESKTLIAGCKNSVIPADGSVKIIEFYAFRNCTGLTSITIPDSITDIGKYAFKGCTDLTSVTFKKTDGWYLDDFDGNIILEEFNVTASSTNAVNLPDAYCGYNWRRDG